ncbi:MAG: ABC transporter ATP-binding protein [Candidatus Caldarchaeum sp.]|nr:ABC transporter ATP-binding protein [Candidatus Caldarchaeum sp.]
MSVLVEVQGLKVYFPVRRFLKTVGVVKAVDGVSVALEKGETLALVGESGCGKTTFGKALLGAVKPFAGKIYFDGQEINSVDDRQLKAIKRRIGAVFQDPYSSLNPMFTIYRIVEEPLVVHGIGSPKDRKETVFKALEDVKLVPAEDFAYKYPHMISGGQRQRVAIARAIISRPEFIVADEPVTMLDASIRVEILLLLREIQRKLGLTMVYITHDIATAKYFSDRIAVMYAGKFVELGPTKDVLKNPSHPYTQALIDAIPDPDPRNRLSFRKVVGGEPPSLINPPSGCRFHPRCPFFMQGKCDASEPPLYSVGPDRFTACFLAEHQS